MSDDSPSAWSGLWTDIVREAKLSNLSLDRSHWTPIFLGGCLVVLLAVPLVVVNYAQGMKRFHKGLAEQLSGTCDLTTNAFGFPLYPIAVTGTFASRPVSVKTVQKDIYKPMLASDYYKKRQVRITTHFAWGTDFSGPQAFSLRVKGFVSSLPDGWFALPTDKLKGAEDWEIATTDRRFAAALFDAEVGAALRDLDKGLPGLVVEFAGGGFHATCGGPLRGEGAIQPALRLLAFCELLQRRLAAITA